MTQCGDLNIFFLNHFYLNWKKFKFIQWRRVKPSNEWIKKKKYYFSTSPLVIFKSYITISSSIHEGLKKDTNFKKSFQSTVDNIATHIMNFYSSQLRVCITLENPYFDWSPSHRKQPSYFIKKKIIIPSEFIVKIKRILNAEFF